MALIRLRGTCPDSGVCPTVYRCDTDPEIGYVQGRIVTDPTVLDGITVPPHETVVEVPLSLITGLSVEEAG